MKLELKHLAPYLPYGLEVIYTHTKERGSIRNLYDIEEYNDIKLGINWLYGEHIWMFKPILRPLSDLTKEIEVDSELTTISKDNTWGRFDEIATLKPHQLRFIQLREYELLLEYHFDVFGLIEQGLAIDINTLEL